MGDDTNGKACEHRDGFGYGYRPSGTEAHCLNCGMRERDVSFQEERDAARELIYGDPGSTGLIALIERARTAERRLEQAEEELARVSARIFHVLREVESVRNDPLAYGVISAGWVFGQLEEFDAARQSEGE